MIYESEEAVVMRVYVGIEDESSINSVGMWRYTCRESECVPAQAVVMILRTQVCGGHNQHSLEGQICTGGALEWLLGKDGITNSAFTCS